MPALLSADFLNIHSFPITREASSQTLAPTPTLSEQFVLKQGRFMLKMSLLSFECIMTSVSFVFISLGQNFIVFIDLSRIFQYRYEIVYCLILPFI